MMIRLLKENHKENDFMIVNGVLKEYNGTDLEVHIPNYVKVIDNSVFDSKRIAVVHIPDSVYEIRSSAFRRCKLLEKVYMGGNVKIIDEYAFTECENLSQVNSQSKGEINLPDSVGCICESAFESCYGIKSVICNGAIHIGEFAFYNCVNMDSIKTDAYIAENALLYTKVEM